MSRRHHGWFAANAIAPGSGLVLAGETLSGTIVGLIFIPLAVLALFANLIVPDDFTSTWRALLIGGAIGVFAGAQIRLIRRIENLRKAETASARRTALATAREALIAGDADRAWEALAPLEDVFETDLLVAYRLAQIVTLRGRSAEALRAWQHVRKLDRHSLYGDESRRQIELLRPAAE